ncbi:unnamed protein product [Ectocarpus sp. 12 AP-2014]
MRGDQHRWLMEQSTSYTEMAQVVPLERGDRAPPSDRPLPLALPRGTTASCKSSSALPPRPPKSLWPLQCPQQRNQRGFDHSRRQSRSKKSHQPPNLPAHKPGLIEALLPSRPREIAPRILRSANHAKRRRPR